MVLWVLSSSYTTVDIAGTPVSAWVDPGSLATIMSILDNRTKAATLQEALPKPKPLCRTKSQGLSQYSLRWIWSAARRVTTPVYLRSDQGPTGEPCLLGTYVMLLIYVTK